jgi:hypothetical protein
LALVQFKHGAFEQFPVGAAKADPFNYRDGLTGAGYGFGYVFGCPLTWPTHYIGFHCFASLALAAGFLQSHRATTPFICQLVDQWW